jgi:predicted CXXCH cytochrome family protein
MSFIVRQISRTSDGREIVRPSQFDTSSIRVGRDASCEVHLADLAVDLHHAVITSDGRGRVTVESVSGLAFDSDGRSTKLARLETASGGELRFGGHRLTLSGDADTIIITAERVTALSDSSAEKDQNGVFTLKGQLIGRRSAAWLLTLLVLGVFLAWPLSTYSAMKGEKIRPAGFHADTMWSSGSLSLAHKSLENNCQACHVKEFVTVSDSSCLTCHKDDAHDHADPKRVAMSKESPDFFGRATGYIRASLNIPEGRCVECHTEHEGAGKMQPTAQKFCTDCHASLNTRLTDTKLPNAGNFGTQHPQFRPAVIVDPTTKQPVLQRISLDAKPAEDSGLKFPHAIHLSKTNGIARMAQTMARDQGFGASLVCKDCHTPSADGTRFQPVSMEGDCQMCHSLAFDQIGGTLRTLRHGEPAQVVADVRAYYRSTTPVRPINLGGMVRRRPGNYSLVETRQDYAFGVAAWPGRAEGAVRALFTQGGACFDCHSTNLTPAGWSVRKVVQTDRYMMKGWFDHNAHKSETCQSCHGAERSNKASDVLLPDLKSCRTCHVGEGGAALHSVKTPVESSCAMCHDYHVDEGAPWRTKTEVDKAKGKKRFPDVIASAN